MILHKESIICSYTKNWGSSIENYFGSRVTQILKN